MNPGELLRRGGGHHINPPLIVFAYYQAFQCTPIVNIEPVRYALGVLLHVPLHDAQRSLRLVPVPSATLQGFELGPATLWTAAFFLTATAPSDPPQIRPVLEHHRKRGFGIRKINFHWFVGPCLVRCFDAAAHKISP